MYVAGIATCEAMLKRIGLGVLAVLGLVIFGLAVRLALARRPGSRGRRLSFPASCEVPFLPLGQSAAGQPSRALFTAARMSSTVTVSLPGAANCGHS